MVIVDPWWNQAIEQQAFGRVYRCGQLKETYIVRMSAYETIESRMLTIQEAKMKELELADQEFCPEKHLMNSDFHKLFGKVVTGPNGESRIESDYENDDCGDDDDSDDSESSSDSDSDYEDD